MKLELTNSTAFNAVHEALQQYVDNSQLEFDELSEADQAKVDEVQKLIDKLDAVMARVAG